MACRLQALKQGGDATPLELCRAVSLVAPAQGIFLPMISASVRSFRSGTRKTWRDPKLSP